MRDRGQGHRRAICINEISRKTGQHAIEVGAKYGCQFLTPEQTKKAFPKLRRIRREEGTSVVKNASNSMKKIFLDTRFAGGALAAAKAPAFTAGTTESEKKATSTINLIRVRRFLPCATLQEFAGIVLAILYSLAAFALGAALLFYTFTR
jgi:hypothetical protein